MFLTPSGSVGAGATCVDKTTLLTDRPPPLSQTLAARRTRPFPHSLLQVRRVLHFLRRRLHRLRCRRLL